MKWRNSRDREAAAKNAAAASSDDFMDDNAAGTSATELLLSTEEKSVDADDEDLIECETGMNNGNANFIMTSSLDSAPFGNQSSKLRLSKKSGDECCSSSSDLDV